MKKFLVYFALTLSLLMFAESAIAQDMSDIERDAKALELYIQDKEDHEKHCPYVVWKQPKIDVYKDKLESQLPENCKSEDN